MSDSGLSYRSKEEVAQIREQRDPIEKVRGWLLKHNLATEQELAVSEIKSHFIFVFVFILIFVFYFFYYFLFLDVEKSS